LAQGGSGGGSDSDATSEGDATTSTPSDVLCTGSTDEGALVDVWSDARGPFVSAPGGSLGSSGLYWKTASGWTQITSSGGGYVTGIPLGNLTLGGPCGGAEVLRVDGTVIQCSSWFPPDQFIVTSTLAYAPLGQDVASYDGNVWTQYQTRLPSSVKTLWADASTVAVALYSGEVFSSTNGGSWVSLGVPSGSSPDLVGINYFPIIWGFASNDIWVGFRDGRLFEFDGATWHERTKVVDTCAGWGIYGMWGMDGVLYVLSPNRLARWQSGALEIIKDFNCDTALASIWGTSISEVYVVGRNRSRAGTTCGIIEVFRVNGLQVTEI
jgi:hypothetical protein